MVKKKEFSVPNDSIKLDSCLASISNKSKYSFKKTQNVLFGISAKRNFRIWMWVNSVPHSGWRNETRKLYFS